MNGLWTAATDVARNVAHSPALLVIVVVSLVLGVWVWRVEYVTNNREN